MAIQSLFGPSIADVQELRRQQAEKEIAGAGQEFGVFGPLYQAGLRFGNQAVSGINTLMGAQDPMLKKATDIQSVLSNYQGQDLTSGSVLGKISTDLAKLGYTREAFGLAQEARTALTAEGAASRAERGLVIQEEAAKDTRYKNNPELLLQDALVLPETDPKRTALLTRYSQIAEERNFGIAKRQSDLAQAQADLAKTQAETERISLITKEMKADQQGNKVNNNGVRIGTFDKTGRYKAPDGTVYSAKAVETARTEHDAASDLLFRLERLTDSDINAAYGSAMDYTTVPGGGLISSTKTYSAQTKINEVGIRSVLNNLQQLKGPSSDKEMAQMIKDFPGYQADPDVMRAWVNRAVQATNRYLKRNESRYGFDTDYGVENRFKTRETKQKERTEGSAGEWRVL